MAGLQRSPRRSWCLSLSWYPPLLFLVNFVTSPFSPSVRILFVSCLSIVRLHRTRATISYHTRYPDPPFSESVSCDHTHTAVAAVTYGLVLILIYHHSATSYHTRAQVVALPLRVYPPVIRGPNTVHIFCSVVVSLVLTLSPSRVSIYCACPSVCTHCHSC